MVKRVVFLLPSFQGGGAERVMLRLLEALDREKYEPVLVVGLAQGPLSSLVPRGLPCVELGQSRARSGAVPLVKALRKVRPDIVFSTLGLGLAALAVKPVLQGRPKMVMRLGNTLSAEGLGSRTRAREWATRAALRRLYRRADVIIAQSDYMLHDAVDYLGGPPGRFVRIYNPVDTGKPALARDLERAQERTGGPHLVSVGKLQRVKGFDVLLVSFALVRQERPEATLTILGEGPERATLADQAADLGIADAVRMPGWVQDPEGYIVRSDVFVLPSRFEGLSNALLEALSLGVPVVVTDCPSGHREVVADGRNGWFARTDDPADLARQIVVALNERHEATLKESASDIRQRFCTDTITREFERVFDRVSP